MKYVFILLLLPQLVSSGCTSIPGEAELGCEETVEGHLLCTFPENVNSTKTDFRVYFYPVDGGEEPLLDCGWVNSQLYCIKQEGVECKSPVNTTAVIIIPTRFLEENGKYRCVSDGHRHNTIKPCQLSSKQVVTNAASRPSYLSSVVNFVYLVTILLSC